jgi:hypothetical protein
LGTTTGSPPSMIAMHEFVVPRSIPRMWLIPEHQQCLCLAPQAALKLLSYNVLRRSFPFSPVMARSSTTPS